MQENISTNSLNILFLIVASIFPVEHLNLQGDCLEHFLKTADSFRWAPISQYNQHAHIPPHDDDEETEVEVFNDVEESEVNERPGRKRKSRQKLC